MIFFKLKPTTIIVISSILTILLVISYLICGYRTLDFPDFYTVEDKLYEISTILFHLFFLFPAVLGLVYGRKRRIITLQNTIQISLAYILYFFLTLFSHLSFFWASDPLETGLTIIAGLSYSVVLGIIMLEII